ncbi:hypothetical protein QJS10_CPA08g01587 [Acorus calamus]|uniref:Uncharacterized protein n=1 Tax=Acorus calamus TaxID=4465 RepID=A0AAV9EEB3_ACOCL|nr:hypothetical protein QJS10_CPA08g01587 [Acorus calamus]
MRNWGKVIRDVAYEAEDVIEDIFKMQQRWSRGDMNAAKENQRFAKKMLCSSAILPQQIPPIPGSLPPFSTNPQPVPTFLFKTQTRRTFGRRRLTVHAEGNNGLKSKEGEGTEGPINGQDDLGRILGSWRWTDLIKPDGENIVAVGLAGLLAWASAQVLWQLFYISVAILLAALKYSFIAAFLLFILITLL